VVYDKKRLAKGPNEAEEQCKQSEIDALVKLAPTEPYLPKVCEQLLVPGLTARDFHVLVDGKEQRIQGVTSERDWIHVRDNHGLHWEHWEAPAGIWSTADKQLHAKLRQAGDPGAFSYNITFAPDKSDRAGCRKIKVKVDRPQSVVLARTEYCDGQSPSDILRGSKFGNLMEQQLASGEPGRIAVSLQTAFFYTGTDKARVRISLEFPQDSLNRWWESDWALHATIGTLGMVYNRDGGLATRFSDFGCCYGYRGPRLQGTAGLFFGDLNHPSPDSGLVNPFTLFLSFVERNNLPTRYETQVELAPGEYDLQVVLSDGEKFGRAEKHLNIDKYDGKELALSSVMLCKRFRDARVAAVEAAAANLAPQYVPLVSKGIQVTPTGDTRFEPGEEPLIAYFEIYEPLLARTGTAKVQFQMRVVEVRTGELKIATGLRSAESWIGPTNPVIPIAEEVKLGKLPKGAYRLKVQATDSAGRSTAWRTADFMVE
jgi:hypothetical protein